jgi:hypothetical protein
MFRKSISFRDMLSKTEPIYIMFEITNTLRIYSASPDSILIIIKISKMSRLFPNKNPHRVEKSRDGGKLVPIQFSLGLATRIPCTPRSSSQG